MVNTIKCSICNNLMIYKMPIEDPESNSINKYKHMHYCEHCDSYEFILIDKYKSPSIFSRVISNILTLC